MRKNWWSITQQYWEANDKELNIDTDEFEKKLNERQKYKESFWGKINEWWWVNIGYKIDDIIQGIKNIIIWFPVLWKDRDYDKSHILKILKQKLYLISKYHIEKQFYVGWEREVERMILCIKLIDYIINDHYNEIVHDYLSSKYGKSTFEFIPLLDKEGYSQLNIKRENIENGKYTQEEYEKEYSKLIHEANDKRNKARTLLFKILSWHFEKWWI